VRPPRVQFELGAMCVKAILKLSDMPFETGKRWIGNQNAFVEALRSALIPLPPQFNSKGVPAIDFARAYHELGMDQAYDSFLTTASQQTADEYWDIPVLKGVSSDRVVKTLRHLGVDVYL